MAQLKMKLEAMNKRLGEVANEKAHMNPAVVCLSEGL